MDPSSFIDLTSSDETELLSIARQSIGHGFDEQAPLEPDPARVAGNLARELGVFVTITQRSALRGCVGSLEPRHPLAQGVAFASFNAAFHDPRFPALSRLEAALVQIEISVLSPLQEITVGSNDELLASLTPQVDGLLLDDSGRRATFLPKVWDKLPEPRAFVAQLKTKAGLPDEHWSDTIRCYRYRTTTFSETAKSATAAG